MARILIVDDEENIRFMLSKTLRDRRHEVYEASDGDQALKFLQENQVDLVVTDIIMPDREGLECIQLIRKNWPDVKIIAMSGGGRTGKINFLEVAKAFGAESVMRKPFSMSDFRDEVAKTLDKSLWQTD